LFPDVSEDARVDFRRKALTGPCAFFGWPVEGLRALFGSQPRFPFGVALAEPEALWISLERRDKLARFVEADDI
jgi:hypothetical protein